MSEPMYGQRSDPYAAPECPRHPGVRSVDYCKRCNRPMCAQCAVRTEVRSLCVECAGKSGRFRAFASSSRPVITYGIIALCVVVYLVSFVSGNAFYRYMAFTPGAGYLEPWRFLTTSFLHANIGHIIFNMLSLYTVGRAIEPALRKWRFALLYLLSAVGGSLFVLAWGLIDPTTLVGVTVGASGAVFGMFAAVFVMQKTLGLDTRSILALLVINLVYGFLIPGISWQAHLGGMIAGAAATWVFIQVGRPRVGVTAKKQNRQSVIAGVVMVLVECALIALTYRVIFEALGA